MSTHRLLATRAALAGLAAMVLAGPAEAEAQCANAEATPDVASPREMGNATVCLVNRERTRRGLRSLRANGSLSRAASAHTRDMAARRYFSHISRDGRTPIDRVARAGYLRGAGQWQVGENLAWGSRGLATPRRIVASWMSSPVHRRNILDRRFRDIGIGVVERRPAVAFYTTTFGFRS